MITPSVKLFFQNLPAQPRNSTHINGRILTPLARAFKDDIQERMERTKLRDHFKNCTAIKLFLTCWTPRKTFLTLDGNLSKTSIDCDSHKLFVDEVARYLGFNDGLAYVWEVEKLPIDGDEWCFEVLVVGDNPKWDTIEDVGSIVRKRQSQGYLILD